MNCAGTVIADWVALAGLFWIAMAPFAFIIGIVCPLVSLKLLILKVSALGFFLVPPVAFILALDRCWI